MSKNSVRKTGKNLTLCRLFPVYGLHRAFCGLRLMWRYAPMDLLARCHLHKLHAVVGHLGAELAREIGYPVIIKAALGGGGKGMRTAWTPEEFESAFQTAQKETEMAFADSTMYIEHFVENPRHIEFQILADKYGNVIHLGERDDQTDSSRRCCGEDCLGVAVPDIHESVAP